MAFKVAPDGASKKPTLAPVWVTGDFKFPEPVVIANGVVFALSNGENPHQTEGGGAILYTHQRLLTDAERAADTNHAVLYALDAKTGKVLYDSGDEIKTWVHFSGLAVSDGRVYAVDHDSRIYCFGLKGHEKK
jgi:outer membrane protein assembly factor BamB